MSSQSTGGSRWSHMTHNDRSSFVLLVIPCSRIDAVRDVPSVPLGQKAAAALPFTIRIAAEARQTTKENVMPRVIYEKDGRIARITLNRPDVLNAIDDQLPQELADCVGRANGDPDVHVIVLAGAGAAFCA